MEAFDVTYGRSCIAGGLEYRVPLSGNIGMHGCQFMVTGAL